MEQVCTYTFLSSISVHFRLYVFRQYLKYAVGCIITAMLSIIGTLLSITRIVFMYIYYADEKNAKFSRFF